MEKSWVIMLGIWIISVFAFWSLGVYDNFLYAVLKISISLIFIYIMYKTFSNPFPTSVKDIRKNKKEIYKKLRRGVDIGVFSLIISVIFLIITGVMGHSTLAFWGFVGTVLSLAFVGMWDSYYINRRLFKVLLTILVILSILFPLIFVEQVKEFAFYPYGVLIIYLLLLALYGTIKLIFMTPKLMVEMLEKKAELETRKKK
jgi:hypothetical protein